MTEKDLEAIDNLPLTERVQKRLDANLCVSKEDIQLVLDRDKWISVEDELPSDYEYVLVAIPNEEPFMAKIDYLDPQYANIKTWYVKGAPWRGGNWGESPDESKITHWKPLPKPPK